MSRPDRRVAAKYAGEVLRRVSWSGIPVEPVVVAERLGVTVQPSDQLDRCMSGCLVECDGSFGILYDSTIASEEHQRFTIAHELGHFSIPWHRKRLAREQIIHRSRSHFSDYDAMEVEADTFAAELLMPETEYRKALLRHNRGLPGIKRLAEEFRTSLTATAIRYALHTPDPAAVIVSGLSGQIDYAFISEELRGMGAARIPKGSPVPRASLTHQVIRRLCKSEDVLRDEGISHMRVWFRNDKADFELDEDVMPLGRTGQVLTVLSTERAPTDFREKSD